MTHLPQIALIGNPNCGKTSLFNLLTGGYAKVCNYPGVTVEKRLGLLHTTQGIPFHLIDLPGVYSLHPRTLDEQITYDILKEPLHGLIIVVDASSLARGLALTLELKVLQYPSLLVLNRMDLAQQQGLQLNLSLLSQELNLPIIPMTTTQKKGLSLLRQHMETHFDFKQEPYTATLPTSDPKSRFQEADRILALTVQSTSPPRLVWNQKLDHFFLHPLWGTLFLSGIFWFLFQVMFNWAEIPMHFLETSIQLLIQWIESFFAPGPLRDLLTQGVITGIGSVLIFLPQILLLFLFILILEDSGYLSRTGFLMDRVMRTLGLNGKAIIPLLSSFACAIPGILATRTLEHKKDRLITILIAPLLTCSARLPIYSLLIATFIPNNVFLKFFHLQGLVLFGLYCVGILAAFSMAILLQFFLRQEPDSFFLIELPRYQWPHLKTIILELWLKTKLFFKKATTGILLSSVLLWFVASYPKPPLHSLHPAIYSSYAGQLGRFLEPYFQPIGFNWKIIIALIPSFAAREMMLSSLATVYAIENTQEHALLHALQKDWSLATALSLLIWYSLACQCFSTLVIVKKETQSWYWPLFLFFYMNTLGYLGAWVTYQLAVFIGLG